MIKIMLAVILFTCCLTETNAQNSIYHPHFNFDSLPPYDIDTVPPYQKDSLIPAFSILETDSATWFNKEQLPHNKPVVIIYFSPDCGHCQLTAHEFEQKRDKLKDVFFVWVSYLSITEIKSFAETYKLANQKNIRVGRDIKYYVPSFFRVKFTPFIAVYDKEGKLLQTYESGTDPDTIIHLLHQQGG